MNKKLQVFVSSTYTDLIEERQAAVEAILDAGHIPAGMELFKAGKSQMKTICKWIDESDVYMLILGGRYGSIEEESGLSYTELEYRYAFSKNMPVFAIVLDESFLFTKAALKTKDAIFEKDNVDKYDSFKEFIKTNVVKFANNVDQVSTIIHSHLSEILNDTDYTLIGWIRGNQINNSTNLYNEYPYNKLYQYLKELHSSLECLLLDVYTYRNKSNNFESNWEKFAIMYYQLHSFYHINKQIIIKFTNELKTIFSYWDQLVSILLKVQNNQNGEFYLEDNVNFQNISQSMYDELSKLLYISSDSNIFSQ